MEERLCRMPESKLLNQSINQINQFQPRVTRGWVGGGGGEGGG